MINATPIHSMSKFFTISRKYPCFSLPSPKLFSSSFSFRHLILFEFRNYFFYRETAKVLLRVITARSVKLLLVQLQELDLFQAQWFNNYAAEHPPTEGDKFIQELFNAKGTVVTDPNTQLSHNIDPQNLAHRVLQIRDDMAKKATLDLPAFTERCNTGVLRSHLERNTFISGGVDENDGKYKARRGYFRPPTSK